MSSRNSPVRQNSPVAKTFLDLPFKVRCKIYFFCGLIRECPIHLTTEYARGPGYGALGSQTCFYLERKQGISTLWGAHTGFSCSCERLPTALLLVSKAIREEVFATLCGQNYFVLRAHTKDDLMPLLDIRVEDLPFIDSLLIRLNCWPCPWGHEGDELDDLSCAVCETPKSQADPILSSETRQGRDLIRMWTAVCQRLSEAILPAKLKLTFICDVMDLESAHQVVDPLRILPALKSCTIRLGRSRNDELRSLAKKSSLDMTRTTIRPFPFLFEALPKEIRLLILSFTHLSTPGTYAEKFNKLAIRNSRLMRYYDPDLEPHFNPPSCCLNARALLRTAAAYRAMRRTPTPVSVAFYLWSYSLSADKQVGMLLKPCTKTQILNSPIPLTLSLSLTTYLLMP